MEEWLPPGPRTVQHFTSSTKDGLLQADTTIHQTTKNSTTPEHNTSSRGSLLERMANRAGFRPADLAQNVEVQSPYLIIPPGLSPTTLLESPGFFSNSVATSVPDLLKEDFFRDMDISSFALEPITESGAHYFGASQEQSPALQKQKDSETDQRGNGDPKIDAEEGYSYRKYGQKKVKGSSNQRSYYKCSYLDCPVKKTVEISTEGEISKTIYKGEHNHPKPLPGQKPTYGSRRILGNMLLENDKQDTGTGGDTVWKCNNIKVTSLPTLDLDYSNTGMSLQKKNGSQPELGDVADGSSTFLYEENDDRVTHGSVSLDCHGEGDESDSKRRKTETHKADKVIIQTISDVDILDDGYRWRKYGQKIVKGNPNPRSYYKCTSAGCYIRKHIERASHNLKLVITAYEGRHNHAAPIPRNISHYNLGVSRNILIQSTAAIQNQLQRNEPYQVHGSMAKFESSMAQFERNPPLGSFVQSVSPPLGPYQDFGYGFDPSGFSNLAMGGLQPNQGQLPDLPNHQFPRQHNCTMIAESLMLPQVEPNAEPLSGSSSTLPNSS